MRKGWLAFASCMLGLNFYGRGQIGEGRINDGERGWIFRKVGVGGKIILL